MAMMKAVCLFLQELVVIEIIAEIESIIAFYACDSSKPHPF